jgi:hypothetical protein
MSPYKKKENNEIEMLSLTAGAITLYSGIIFVAENNELSGFRFALMIIMFWCNVWFLVNWGFLIL